MSDDLKMTRVVAGYIFWRYSLEWANSQLILFVQETSSREHHVIFKVELVKVFAVLRFP